MEEIAALLQSAVPIIWVSTHEEARFIRKLKLDLAGAAKRTVFIWSSSFGVVTFEDWTRSAKCTGEWANTTQLNTAIAAIEKYRVPDKVRGAIFILMDPHPLITAGIPRQLRDFINNYSNQNKTLVVTAGQLAHGPGLQRTGLEPTLEKQIHVVDFDLPSREELSKIIKDHLVQFVDKDKKLVYNYTDKEVLSFATALQGMTEQEAIDALLATIAHLKRVDVDKLLLEKKAVLRKSEILEYISNKPSFDDVGGLDEAKKFFTLYSDQFTPEAREFGVEPLRGVLLLGCPGTGKSLLAKAVASIWKHPLLRLDVGRVMSGIVGSSENRMRDAIAQAVSCAPCCLWIDEIEKALSGTKSSNMSDSGTLSRVFGTLLTAMEEGMKDVIILATANDITQIPPELIRRFNEVFFVDLPEEEERIDILRIHLLKRKRDPKALKIDMDKVVKSCHHYTGSEIEKSVQEAIARSWRDGRRPIKTEDLIGALQDTKPIAKVMAEQINTLRDWARDRARYASSLAARSHGPGNQTVVTSGGNKLQVADVLDDIEEVETPKDYKKRVASTTRVSALQESIEASGETK
jgi:ATP-dependent 26S proteasome regulatory subunit